tara:strand:- start:14415 stop:16013 length:1599 start_codon:yes stop_codon:yes gene_type:complete
MFANGGSVYIPPALRYMAQNPDVFNASVANARARGLSGQNMQGQIERDAALHYAFHGQGEGREYGGRTFLGGLLEPRLGDTFGLSPERKKELEDERDAVASPPATSLTPPAEGLVSLVPIDEIEAGGPNFAEGGEVYETSPVVQGYLQANADVLNHAVRVAQGQGVPPGKSFQRIVENVAREHWNTYGKNEGRSIAGYGDDGASLMSQEQIATNQGIFANPVNERMLAIAQLLQGTRNVFDDPENMEGTAFFGTNPQGGFYDPYSQQTTRQIDNLLTKISPSLRQRIVTGNSPGQSDEDMVARDMNPVLKGLFQKRGLRNESLFQGAGGQPELLRAYAQLGIEPPDVSGQRGTQQYGQAVMYDTIGGTPLSLAGQELTGIMNAVNQGRSSIGADGTGGASAIGDGGPTGTGYDSFGAFMADVPNMLQQIAAVPTVNPLGIANQIYQMYTGNIMKNPYDTSDATGTPKDRSVPSPMDFGGGAIGNAPPSREQLQAMDQLQFNSPGYPGLAGGQGLGAFGGVGLGGDGSGYGGV